jgi:hypothetical protein
MDFWPSEDSGRYIAYSEKLRSIMCGTYEQKELNAQLYVGIKQRNISGPCFERDSN